MRTHFLLLSTSLLLGACTTTLPTPDPTPVKPTPTSSAPAAMEPDTQEYGSITFTGKSSIIDHEGRIEIFEMETVWNPNETDNFALAQLFLTIDATSLRTDTAMLDGHLQKEDFFDTATYPTITFVSTSIESTGDNTFNVTGDLTIKGTTESIMIPVNVRDNVLTASYELPRKIFDIGNDSYGDKILDEFVPLQFTLPL